MPGWALPLPAVLLLSEVLLRTEALVVLGLSSIALFPSTWNGLPFIREREKGKGRREKKGRGRKRETEA